jgi:hypothetical protein
VHEKETDEQNRQPEMQPARPFVSAKNGGQGR